MKAMTLDGALDALTAAQNESSRLRLENTSLDRSYREHIAEIGRLREQRDALRSSVDELEAALRRLADEHVALRSAYLTETDGAFADACPAISEALGAARAALSRSQPHD